MPTIFDSGYGAPRGPSRSPGPYGAWDYYSTGLTGNQWNAQNSPFPPGAAPTIGAWPPAGYNPMGGGGGGPTFGFDPTTGIFTDPKPDGSGGTSAGGGGGGGTLTTPYGGGPLSPAIQGLITPGLVPDIARQSAEVAGGRGVGGSPAGASTAVRMSEQNYLQRLGLANTLMTGEAGRALPYQITPYQSAQMQLARDIALFRAQAPLVTGLPRYGSRGGGTYGGGTSGSGGGSIYPFSGGNYGQGWGGGYGGGGSNFGASGSGAMTLDDIYEQLGFGNFGSLSGDTTGANQPPEDFWEGWY